MNDERNDIHSAYTNGFNNTVLRIYMTETQLREFKVALSRAVNTWEAAPLWVKNLYINMSRLSETTPTTEDSEQQSLPLKY